MKSHEIRQKLLNTPFIPKEVYQNLPPFLKELCSKFSPGRKRDVFLSSVLVMFSGIMYRTKAQHRGEDICPQSFLCIVAPSARGKSTARHAKRPFDALHQQLKQTGNNKLEKEGESNTHNGLFIPANNSNAMFLKMLEENKGQGIIFEEEIDTMAKSFQQEWGNFSDELRRIYDNQPISYARKENNTKIEIEEPKLALLLTGTPNQIKSLIPSAENGLFSRMLFYCFEEEVKWDPLCSDTLNLSEYYKNKGKEVKEFYTSLQSKQVTFKFSEAQLTDMNSYFDEELNQGVFTHGYESSSVVFRACLNLLRLAMVLTSIKKWDEGNTNEQVQCSNKDFETAKMLCHTYLRHSLTMLEIIPHSDVKEHKSNRDKFYDQLRFEFKRCEAVLIGKRLNLSPASIGRYIEGFEKKGLLMSPKYGWYQKVLSI